MYIPQIKEKHSLVDLARYGTRSRKNIHPNVLIGACSYPRIYKEGDLLDANAVYNIINSINPSENKKYEDLINIVRKNQQLAELRINSLIDKTDYIENSISKLKIDHDKDIEEIKQQQGQDVQDIKQYVEQEIDKAKAIVVYDDLGENLLVYNVKV